MNDRESKVFAKIGTGLDVKNLRAHGGVGWGAILGEDDFGLVVIYGLPRKLIEDSEDFHNSFTILGISFGNESEVISKDSSGPLEDILIGFQFLALTSASMPLDSLFMHNIKRYRDRRSPCLMPLEGLKKVVFPPLTRIATEKEIMQEKIRLDLKNLMARRISESLRGASRASFISEVIALLAMMGNKMIIIALGVASSVKSNKVMKDVISNGFLPWPGGVGGCVWWSPGYEVEGLHLCEWDMVFPARTTFAQDVGTLVKGLRGVPNGTSPHHGHQSNGIRPFPVKLRDNGALRQCFSSHLPFSSEGPRSHGAVPRDIFLIVNFQCGNAIPPHRATSLFHVRPFLNSVRPIPVAHHDATASR
ncbi:hypothetical protein FXO38_32545 [Capsicum annuum]|nr:hypothetical protein FXO38_32545 [Capsicum annuum]